MTTDFSKPVVTDGYASLLPALQGALVDFARQFEPVLTGTAHTNVPNGTVRWNATNKNWERYNLATTAWVTLPSAGDNIYGISISGNAANVSGVVALVNGGTGGTTQVTARAGLGAAASDNPTFTGGIKETRSVVGASNIDMSLGSVFTRTIAAITTFTVSNVPAAGTVGSFMLDLTNGGAFAITWWAGVKWAGGAQPALTVAGRDVLGFFTHDGGTTWTALLCGRDVR